MSICHYKFDISCAVFIHRSPPSDLPLPPLITYFRVGIILSRVDWFPPRGIRKVPDLLPYQLIGFLLYATFRLKFCRRKIHPAHQKSNGFSFNPWGFAFQLKLRFVTLATTCLGDFPPKECVRFWKIGTIFQTKKYWRFLERTKRPDPDSKRRIAGRAFLKIRFLLRNFLLRGFIRHLLKDWITPSRLALFRRGANGS